MRPKKDSTRSPKPKVYASSANCRGILIKIGADDHIKSTVLGAKSCHFFKFFINLRKK